MKKNIFICFILIVCVSMSLQAQNTLKHRFDTTKIYVSQKQLYLDSIQKIERLKALRKAESKGYAEFRNVYVEPTINKKNFFVGVTLGKMEAGRLCLQRFGWQIDKDIITCVSSLTFVICVHSNLSKRDAVNFRKTKNLFICNEQEKSKNCSFLNEQKYIRKSLKIAQTIRENKGVFALLTIIKTNNSWAINDIEL